MKKISVFLAMLFIAVSSIGQRINEVASNNLIAGKNSFDIRNDWVEIYNDKFEPINLAGYFLSDDPSNPTKFEIGDTLLEPGDYFVLLSDDGVDCCNYMPFSINKMGENIYLYNPSLELLDEVAVPELHINNSYGRIGDKFYIFDDPTPSGLNDTVIGYKGYAQSPTFNRGSGQIAVGTHIVIRSENENTIYYSHKGVRGELVYEKAILVDRTTTIQATAIGDSLLHSKPITRTYFVKEHSHLPIVNLTIDSIAMFDEVYGIYMPGPDASPDHPDYKANFWEDYELQANFEYFDANFNLLESATCEIELHGGSGSRLKPLKSIELMSIGKTSFSYPFFKIKDQNQYQRLLLRNSGNDYCHTCILDGALHHYFSSNKVDVHVDLMAFQPVQAFINGRYVGMMNLREKAGKHYVADKYGYNVNEINVLENWDLNVKNGSAETFRAMWYFARSHNLSDEDNFKIVSNQLDLASLMDYFILELFVNNRDWPNNNLRVWNVPGRTKWSYLCYDLDIAFRIDNGEEKDINYFTYILNELDEVNPHVSILKALLENEHFKRDFVNRYADLLNTILDPSQMISGIEKQKEKVSIDMERHYTKWCGEMDVWRERFEGNYGYIYLRKNYVRNELTTIFNLPKEELIQVDAYPLNAGHVKLNTLLLDSLPFEGMYFPTNLIQLTAIEKDGRAFRHWKNLRTGAIYNSQSIEIDVHAGDHFVAFFEAKDLFELSLYPNPTTDWINLSFSLSRESIYSVKIYSTTGILMYDYTVPNICSPGGYRKEIDLSRFPVGVYILKFNTEIGEVVRRIVKT